MGNISVNDNQHSSSFDLTLQLLFRKFFSGKSESDSCTLNSDSILINRRNVKSEPHTAYHADRDFLLVVLKSRVLATAMSVPGFADKESQPSKLPLPADISNQPKVRRLQYLHIAASIIVDTFVLFGLLGFSKVATYL